jgi:hypothetical protein
MSDEDEKFNREVDEELERLQREEAKKPKRLRILGLHPVVAGVGLIAWRPLPSGRHEGEAAALRLFTLGLESRSAGRAAHGDLTRSPS